MSLLHATWLPAIRTPTSSGRPAMLVWADTWRVAKPTSPEVTPAVHPFTLNHKDLRSWLSKKDLLPNGIIDATACLTLPSKTIETKDKIETCWSGLPLQAGEPIPSKCEWWPWQVKGLAIEPAAISEWLLKIPLSGDYNIKRLLKRELIL